MERTDGDIIKKRLNGYWRSVKAHLSGKMVICRAVDFND